MYFIAEILAHQSARKQRSISSAKNHLNKIIESMMILSNLSELIENSPKDFISIKDDEIEIVKSIDNYMLGKKLKIIYSDNGQPIRAYIEDEQ